MKKLIALIFVVIGLSLSGYYISTAYCWSCWSDTCINGISCGPNCSCYIPSGKIRGQCLSR